MQLLNKGYIARDRQIIIDVPLVPVPKQLVSRDEKDLVTRKAIPAPWRPVSGGRKVSTKHCKSDFGYSLSINVDKRYKAICQVDAETASTHDSQYFGNGFDTANASRDVYADRGYPPRRWGARLNETGPRLFLEDEMEQTADKLRSLLRAPEGHWC